MNDEVATEKPAPKSIIPARYLGRYKDKDWLGEFIDAQATTAVTKDKKTTVKADDGTDTTTTETVETGKRKLDIDKLTALAKANHVDTSKLEAQSERPNFAGRARMTWGNSLRAAAKHRHGLYDLEGNWIEAPAAFLGEAAKTQNPDGTKIVTKTPEATPAADVEAGEVDAA